MSLNHLQTSKSEQCGMPLYSVPLSENRVEPPLTAGLLGSSPAALNF